jgi:hypothetical protein
MTVYTVHEPPPRKRETFTAPERFVFVRDGFHFWAFVLGPLWMLRHRLWLVLVIYLVVVVAIEVALHLLGVSGGVKFVVGFLIQLLVGFEAASLRRWTYARRRWGNLGIVVARNLEEAERRFFDRWTGAPETSASSPSPTPPPSPSPAPVPLTPPTMRIPPASPDVIGLFPEPQSRP